MNSKGRIIRCLSRKVAIRECKKRKNELKKKSILNPESIAMESPNVDGYGPRGSILTHDGLLRRSTKHLLTSSQQVTKYRMLKPVICILHT
jgi:hypothetical protein